MKKEFLEKDIPPFLKALKGKDDGLKVPEGYFEDVEGAVFARLKSAGDLNRPVLAPKKRSGWSGLFIRPKVAMAYAAALAMMLAAVWFIRQSTYTVPETTLFSAELTEEDLESYLLENLEEFDPHQLASLNVAVPAEPLEEGGSDSSPKNNSTPSEIHPDDLDDILDEMTDEELEQIL